MLCKPSWTVLRLKLEVQGIEGYPPDQQRMIYYGRQLEDPSLLKECDLRYESCIHHLFKASGRLSAAANAHCLCNFGKVKLRLVRYIPSSVCDVLLNQDNSIHMPVVVYSVFVIIMQQYITTLVDWLMDCV